MINSKLGIAYKAPWGAVIFKARDRMGARTLQMLLHFLAGMAVAAYLVPEGAAIALACLLLVAGAKALYDYVDAGAVQLGSSAALLAGGALALGLAHFI
ncbi:hypothetical protein [Pollutimonas bauzanensis]|uniref:Uncharacterized protein n=1 Tax=Pollutimonas bauzanensis TaxID=658167 RepID=A0A1M5X4S4_9BURK|nr:hypothetical protein [Pollutimonas bauzanensis]SHH94797.1 hypothetical protein SAMN04488135_106147 [Pollutimonas bauzanensis]